MTEIGKLLVALGVNTRFNCIRFIRFIRFIRTNCAGKSTICSMTTRPDSPPSENNGSPLLDHWGQDHNLMFLQSDRSWGMLIRQMYLRACRTICDRTEIDDTQNHGQSIHCDFCSIIRYLRVRDDHSGDGSPDIFVSLATDLDRSGRNGGHMRLVV